MSNFEKNKTRRMGKKKCSHGQSWREINHKAHSYDYNKNVTLRLFTKQIPHSLSTEIFSENNLIKYKICFIFYNSIILSFHFANVGILLLHHVITLKCVDAKWQNVELFCFSYSAVSGIKILNTNKYILKNRQHH